MEKTFSHLSEKQHLCDKEKKKNQYQWNLQKLKRRIPKTFLICLYFNLDVSSLTWNKENLIFFCIYIN